jgi:SAM-dependent methyltransferase
MRAPSHTPTVDRDTSVNWSEELEDFHEESTRDHPIEVLTRTTILAQFAPLPNPATLVEIGCSTGYLLEDLRTAYPSAQLVGLDAIRSGLLKARRAVPDAELAQADACELPLPDRCADVVLSVNLLEHIAEDDRALAEIRRILRPGARAILVVPVAPRLYDYYDRFLRHERRYSRGELARKARAAGLTVEADFHLGSVVFPGFWATKKWNRLRFDSLSGSDLETRVNHDYGSTKESALFGVACRFERWLLQHGAKLPFGIRGITVVRRPPTD